jgi:hypothetical protein
MAQLRVLLRAANKFLRPHRSCVSQCLFVLRNAQCFSASGELANPCGGADAAVVSSPQLDSSVGRFLLCGWPSPTVSTWEACRPSCRHPWRRWCHWVRSQPPFHSWSWTCRHQWSEWSLPHSSSCSRLHLCPYSGCKQQQIDHRCKRFVRVRFWCNLLDINSQKETYT